MTLPSIPDTLYKLFIFIGLAGFIYAIYSTEKLNIDLNSKLSTQQNLNDSLQIQSQVLLYKVQNIARFSNYVTEIEKLELFKITDSLVVGFENSQFAKIKSDHIRDSAVALLQGYFNEKFQLDKILKVKLSRQKSHLTETDILNTGSLKLYMMLAILSWIVFLAGVFLFERQENRNEESQRLQLAVHSKPKFCESCAKLFSSTRINGSNADGSPNPNFCFECFHSGKIIDNEETLNDFITKLKLTPKFKSLRQSQKRRLLNRVRSLDRWNPDRY